MLMHYLYLVQKLAIQEGFWRSLITLKEEELIKSLKAFIKEDDVILIKASRGLKFEEIRRC